MSWYAQTFPSTVFHVNHRGGHQVTALPPRGADTSVLGSSISSFIQGSLHSRHCEPGSGPPVQDGPSPRRVEASPTGGGPPVGSVWHGLHRPVRRCTLHDVVLPYGWGGSLGLDTLSHEWPDRLLYAFPPLPLISQVIQRVTMGRYKVLLIAPWWPRKHWFARHLRLVHGQPWALPGRVDLLSQAGAQIWHPRRALLQLWAPSQSRSQRLHEAVPRTIGYA